MSFKTFADWMKDVRIVMLACTLLILFGFYAGDIYRAFTKVPEVKDIAVKNRAFVKKNERELDRHDTRIKNQRERIKAVEREQNSTARAVQAVREAVDDLKKSMREDLRIIACTTNEVSQDRYTRFKCADLGL